MAAQVTVGKRKLLLGSPMRRIEDPRLITGNGKYIGSVQMSGMLEASFVRSPYAHAKITKMDGSKVLRCPGVVAFLTGTDLKDVKYMMSAGEKGEGTSVEGQAGNKTP